MHIGKLFSIPFTINELIDRSAHVCPKKLFLFDEESSLKYSEFCDIGRRLSQKLHNEFNLSLGDRLIIACDNSVIIPLFAYATTLLGGIFVPINNQLRGSRLQFIIKDCSPKVIITDSGNFTERCKLKKVFKLDSLKALTQSINKYDGKIEKKPSVIDLDIAIIIYTSGSTGFPKGVALSHSSIMSSTESIARYLKLTESDKIINFNPFSFDYGLYQIFLAASRGATLFIRQNFIYKDEILSVISKEGITVIPFVPSQIVSLYQRDNMKESSFELVRALMNTGAPFPYKYLDNLKSTFPKAEIYSMYGLTECKRVSYLEPSIITHKPNSVGKAMPNCRIRLVNEKGELLPPSKLGQLIVEGRNLMTCYWNNIEETKNVLKDFPNTINKVLYSSDYFYFDSDYDLFFVGRNDDLAKSGDIRISTKDIETLLNISQDIVESAVVAIPDESIENVFYAFVVKEKDSSLNSERILSKLSNEVESRFMIPKGIIFCDSIPKKHNGKTDYQNLKNRLMKNIAHSK